VVRSTVFIRVPCPRTGTVYSLQYSTILTVLTVHGYLKINKHTCSFLHGITKQHNVPTIRTTYGTTTTTTATKGTEFDDYFLTLTKRMGSSLDEECRKPQCTPTRMGSSLDEECRKPQCTVPPPTMFRSPPHNIQRKPTS
jgi:hypothetical protein